MNLSGLLPVSLRRFLRRYHRRLALQRGLHRMSVLPIEQCYPAHVLGSFIYGWGNEAWSADPEFAQGVLDRALALRGDVLECGTGVTTLMLGVLANRIGFRVWSLEHDKHWHDKTASVLKQFGLGNVQVVYSPLHDYGDFTWYAPPMDVMPRAFSLVVCDGPPDNVPGGRYGLLPVMGDRLGPGCEILLDDTVRAGEREILQRWAADLKAEFDLHGDSQTYGRLVIPSASRDNA